MYIKIRIRGLAQMVERLPSKCKSPSLNPSTIKKCVYVYTIYIYKLFLISIKFNFILTYILIHIYQLN
jgi:hypothetical protein